MKTDFLPGPSTMAVARTAFLLVTMALAGCGQRAEQSLDEYFDKVRMRPAAAVSPPGRVVPLELKEDRLHIVRDPFQPLPDRTNQQEFTARDVGIANAGPLAAIPLSSFRLVRTQHGDGQPFGIIAVPGGDLYRVNVGDATGPGATIVAIDQGRIVVQTAGGTVTISEAPATE